MAADKSTATAVMALVILFVSTLLHGQQSGANPAAGRVPVAQPAASGEKLSSPELPSTKDINNDEVETGGGQDAASRFPVVVPNGRRTVGLALEGGGALGLAHIGVLAWLDEHRVPVDRIAGTSMGCLIASLQASGHSPPEMSSIASGDNFQAIFALQSPYDALSFRRKQDRTQMSQAITVGLKHGVGFRNALLTDRGLNNFLLENFSSYARAGMSFDDLPTPLRCVATDLTTLKPVIFRGGPIPKAVRASISIPGVFEPFLYEGHSLADGAIVDNLPSDVARNQLRADVVIAVHLEDAAFKQGDVSSIVSVFSRAYAAGTAETERRGMAAADLVIHVDTGAFSTSDYAKNKELFTAGYQAAERNRAGLEKYALSESDWKSFKAARQERQMPAPGLLKTLTVAGGSEPAQKAVRHDLRPMQNQTISAPSLVAGLKPVQSDGVYGAVFDTFNPAQGTTANQPSDHSSDTGVRVVLFEDQKGPPYLLIGPSLIAMNANVTQTTVDLRLVDQDLGGYGSELRTDVRAGYLTSLSTEYYRLLTPTGFFLTPKLDVIRRPVYIWNNQKRTAEYFDQSAGGGLSFGRTISSRLQVGALWRADVLRWNLRTGQEASPNLSGTAQTALVRVTYDGSDSGTVSPHGFRLEASSGALVHSPGTSLAPVLHVQMMRSIVWKEKNIIGIRAGIDTYFRHSVADPLRFTLGGPLRLSASSIDEYRGTDNYLVSAGYLRQILPLPSGIGQGIYASFGYEAGETWNRQLPAFVRQDVVGALVAVTPLGAISVGASVGDAGRRKAFVTIGRTF